MSKVWGYLWYVVGFLSLCALAILSAAACVWAGGVLWRLVERF